MFDRMTLSLQKGSREYITDKDLSSLEEDRAAELGQRLVATLSKR